MNVEVTSFRPYQKNNLQGFLSILLKDVGLAIRDCTFHKLNGKRWVNLPAVHYTKQDKSLGYSYVVAFPDRRVYFDFQKQALEGLDKYLSRNSR